LPIEEAFPLAQVVIASLVFAAAGVVLLVYFQKRQKDKSL
jgi:hypothetical protein